MPFSDYAGSPRQAVKLHLRSFDRGSHEARRIFHQLREGGIYQKSLKQNKCFFSSGLLGGPGVVINGVLNIKGVAVSYGHSNLH